MANNVTTIAQFTPYTMDELMRPLAILQQKHDQIAEANTELASKAKSLEYFLPKDSKVYREVYAPYIERIRAASENLARNGVLDAKGQFNPETLNELRSLKADYNGVVNPLEDSIKRMKQRKENDTLVKNKDPHAIALYGDKTIDDFYNDPNLGMDSYISGQEFYLEIAKQMEAMAKGQWNNPSIRGFHKYYDLFTQMSGMSPEQVQDFLAESKNGKFKTEFLQTMFDNQLKTFGLAKDLDERGKGRLFNEFVRALPHLIGQSNSTPLDNGRKAFELENLRHAHQRALMKEQQQPQENVAPRSYYKDPKADGTIVNPEEAERTKGLVLNKDGTLNNRFFQAKPGTKEYEAIRTLKNNGTYGTLLNSLLNKKHYTEEDKKAALGLTEEYIRLVHGAKYNLTPELRFNPASVTKYVNSISDKTLEIGRPEGMSSERARQIRSELKNPTLQFNTVKGTIDIRGSYTEKTGTGTTVDKIYVQSIPLKKALPIDTIPLEFVDSNGEVHRELISVDNALAYIRNNATTNDPAVLSRVEALYQSFGQNMAGIVHGGININNRNYGGGDTDASILE